MPSDYLPIEHDVEDTNRSTLAAHHQLGTDRYNASPGNHTHAEGDLGSIPLFDGTEVTLDPNDRQDAIQKIWDLLAQYGVQVVVRVPTPWIAYTYSNSFLASDQPSSDDVAIDYTGTARVFSLCLNRWASQIFPWFEGITTGAGPIVASDWFSPEDDFDSAFDAAAAFLTEAPGPLTIEHEYISSTISGSILLIATNVFTSVDSALMEDFADQTPFDPPDDVFPDYTIPDMGSPHQITLFFFRKDPDISVNPETSIDVPNENIIATEVQNSRTTIYTYIAVYNWKGLVTFDEPVDTFAVANFGIT